VVARYRNPDGSWRTHLTRRVAVRNAQGVAVGLTGVLMDVAEQLAERERADEMTQRSRLVAEAMGVGFWNADIDTGRVHWDEQMYSIHQRDPALGAPSLDDWLAHCVHPDDQAWVSQRVDQANQHWQAHSDMLYRAAQLRDGQEVWLQTWARRGHRGTQPVLFGMHVDVSQRQREQLLLHRERERTRLALAAAEVGIWERDRDGRLVHWNETMYHQRGLAPDDPRPLDELAQLSTHPDDRHPLVELGRQHTETGQPYRFEFRVQRPDGEWRWLATRGDTLRDAKGAMLGVSGVHLDITERKLAETQHQARLLAEQAARDKSDFMAGMSHELRTPMNAMLGFARLLIDDSQDPASPRQLERLAHITQAGQHLLGLINTLLEVSKSGPAGVADQATTDSPAAAPLVTAAHTGVRPLRVLCVEDNPVNLLLVCELLALRPAVQLRTAVDGQSALAAAQLQRPDLLLLDLQLPDISGRDVLRQLRSMPSMQGCRYVALSADAMPERISEALAAGFDDYWTKPIDFGSFLAGIDEQLAAPRG
jgi:PAS domain S-box-containing protein